MDLFGFDIKKAWCSFGLHRIRSESVPFAPLPFIKAFLAFR
ncbi:hypothetical protein CZ787_06465 [Halomonas citrativorans]|uniref:Uncharacterized protein n=1 Tax=Halomonas citrativorans TaxID=2742612 RepID=A0A1R4HX28_9GAMM|nr:hypothetical protein CZ787_06465 [Halomonas citrativorans]